MELLDDPDYDHELVAVHRNAACGLVAIVAIHDTRLGPAIGGCRIHPYPNLGGALTDVLRLSWGMTYKCAISGIPYGGGKAVILADPQHGKSRARLHAMGDFIDSLGGRYITSFDSGTTIEDVRIIGERTAFVGGAGPGAPDASVSTAIGVRHCIEAAWNMGGGNGLAGARVAIQGAGSVGSKLASLLASAGARIVVSDQVAARAMAVAESTGGEAVDPDAIYAVDADIFSPCALGGTLNLRTIPLLRAALVCGAANNQLATPDDASRLRDAGILYCPDYLANAGGIIDLHYQRAGGSRGALAAHLASLGSVTAVAIARAKQEGLPPVAIVDRIVEERLQDARS